MRYEGCLLTADESAHLIDEIDRWCRRTGTNYNRLVIAAGVAVTIRHKVRVKGQRITYTVAAKLRNALEQYRFGIPKDQHKTRLVSIRKTYATASRMSAEEIESRRITRDCCPRCGAVRMDYICGGCLSAKRPSVGLSA